MGHSSNKRTRSAASVGRRVRAAALMFRWQRAAQFEVTVTGQMTGQIVSPQGQGEMAGSGTAWSDVETGVILDSVLVSEAVIKGPDGVPVLRFKVKEERRLDQQMTRF